MVRVLTRFAFVLLAVFCLASLCKNRPEECPPLKWRYQTGSSVYSSPAIDSVGSVYIGSYDDYLYALNPDGTLRWRYQTGGAVNSCPAIGTDGTVYVGSYDYCIYAIQGAGALTDAPWPRFRHDNRNTGRFCEP